MSIDLYPHQAKAVEEIHNGSVLYSRPGAGKTITSLAYFVSKVCGGTYGDYGSMKTPRDLIVITTAKKRDSLDWESQAVQFGISKKKEFSISNIEFIVDSWNNLGKYRDRKDAMFIFDEQRLVGSGAWSKWFIAIAKNNQWIMLTATPGDTWLDYVPVFIANGFYKNRTEFKRRHVVYNNYSKFPKVDHYVEVGRLIRLRNQILVHMPYTMKAVRKVTDVLVEYDEQLYMRVVKDRWHVYENRPLKDVGEMFSVMRKVVNSDASRLRQVEQLMQKHPRVIVFYNFDYELEILRTLKDPGYWTEDDGTGEMFIETLNTSFTEMAEWNGHKHQAIPESERWIYLVQYVAGAEAWDCISTNVIVFYSQTYSYKNYFQAQGRIDRLNSPDHDMLYYNLVSNAPIDLMIAKSLKGKKSFNEHAHASDITNV